MANLGEIKVNVTVNSDFDAKKVLEKLYAEIAKELEIKVEVEKEKGPLTVGDYAKVVGGETGIEELKKGDIVEVGPNNGQHDFRCARVIDGMTELFDRGDLIRATDEEVAEAKAQQAEAKRWAAIGRKPGEFKKGDIVRVTWSNGHNVGDIGEIAFADGSDRPSVRVGNLAQYDRVKLITPVEARFDRKDSEE